MELHLDTSEATKITLKNKAGKILDQYQDDLRFSQSEKMLQVIDELLINNNLTIKSIEKIIVFCGPGSYTGIRVGVTTANFLGFGLNIPVICSGDSATHNKFERPVSAKYLREPFITKKKSRLG